MPRLHRTRSSTALDKAVYIIIDNADFVNSQSILFTCEIKIQKTYRINRLLLQNPYMSGAVARGRKKEKGEGRKEEE